MDVNGKNTRPTYIGLGHELAHIQDTWEGVKDKSEWFSYNKKDGTKGSVPKTEIFATFMENLLRSENKIPLREYYSYGKYSKARIIDKKTHQNTHIQFLINRSAKIETKNRLSKLITVDPNKS